MSRITVENIWRLLDISARGESFAREEQMGEPFKTVRFVLILLFAGVFCSFSPGAASEPLDDSQQLFFSQFRYAVQAHDTSQLIRLTHSASLECVPEEDREVYYGRILDGLVHVLGKRQVVLKAMTTRYSPGGNDLSSDLSSDKNVILPVVPEVLIILEYERQGYKNVASLYVAKENNEWKWVHVCTE